MPVFFLPPDLIDPPHVTVTGELLTHVRDSLRVTLGETLVIGDGHGRRYRTAVTSVTKQAVTARIIDTLTEPPRKAPSVVVGQAMLKGDKMDWVIQKATELGVRTILPLQSRHSIVQPKPDRIETQRTRWQRIALEAAQQSEQWSVPLVTRPQRMSAYLAEGSVFSTPLILAERRDNRHISPSLRSIKLPMSPEDTIALSVGPEGGWSSEEILEAERLGWTSVTLGPKILRAETAAIAALSIIQHRLGELG